MKKLITPFILPRLFEKLDFDPLFSIDDPSFHRFTFPDGTPGQFSFVADESGYRVESPLLPTPPPLPAHAIEQIAKAERERAAGIVHDGQYRGEGSQQAGFSSGSQGGFGGSQGGFRNPQRGNYA